MTTGRGPLPPVFFLAALLLQWGLHSLLPVLRVLRGEWAILGVAPIALGLVVMVVANRRFKTAQTGIHPFGKPSALVATGPFALSRNPMYVCMVLILLGAAIAWGTLSPFVVLPPFVLIISKRFIHIEEAAMSRAFGGEYERYKQRVRRWI
jgi:protein-S-isoprenylcysteine O-methyltransferase Ste14